MLDYKNFVLKSRKFLKNYIKEYNLKSLICGISGGIDSTIAAVLCSKAAKKTNTKLIGVSLMCSTNKQDECSAADLVGNAFCDEYYKENIQEPYEAISKFCMNSSATKGMSTKISEGNIKARLRMIYLWNLSGFRNGVTIDTENKTEYELGFFTLMGDQNYLNPGLHYLWKTEVYELAKYLLQCYEGNKFQAIEASFNLIPTDGNGVSKSDCEQFGLDNYEQVDDVLKTMYCPDLDKISFISSNKLIEYRKSGIGLVSDETKPYLDEYTRLINSYNEQGVDKVMVLHQNTEFKRYPSPIMPDKEGLGL